jgi:hypothetical protein
MAGLVPAIHVLSTASQKAWMPGTSPGMTGLWAPVWRGLEITPSSK